MFSLKINWTLNFLINNFPKVANFVKVSSMNSIGDSEIEKYLSKQFANLFSRYTQ